MDAQFRCTVCGRIGTVGRCCGIETREPLNDLARREIMGVNNTRLIWVIIENDRCGATLVKAYETEEEAKANLDGNEYVDWVELVVADAESHSDE